MSRRGPAGGVTLGLATTCGRGVTMAKVLRCGDLIPGCDAVLEGADVAEVMAKAMEHCRGDHQLRLIPDEFVARVQSAIQDR